jgi:LysM repeat protein
MPNLFQHIIEPGDTLGNLAVWYNTTVEDIEDANPGIDPYNLIIGQAILIPVPDDDYDDMQSNEQWPMDWGWGSPVPPVVIQPMPWGWGPGSGPSVERPWRWRHRPWYGRCPRRYRRPRRRC